MQIVSSASFKCGEFASASLYTATALAPTAWNEPMISRASRPQFATKYLRNSSPLWQHLIIQSTRRFMYRRRVGFQACFTSLRLVMQAPPLFHLAFMTQHTLSFKRPLSDASRMRQILEDYGWDFRTIAHSVWQAKGDAGVVTFYQSGKLVIQTPTPDLLTEMLTLGDDVPANHTKPASPSTARAGSTHDAQARLATFEQWRTGFGAPQITEWIGITKLAKEIFLAHSS